jgi:corrinoid protein of di/trimethylamine methyltransferase
MENPDMILERIKDALVNFDIEGTVSLVKDALRGGVPAYKIVTEGLAKGMDIVGKKYEGGEFFLAELVMAGETMKEAMKILEPHLRVDSTVRKGIVVIGTVKGDVHDIGKNIVSTLLRSAGFEVIDLGTDVPAERFIDAVKRFNPDILGMSALLTTTLANMEDVIKALKREGVRDKVKVIIGGAPVDERFAAKIGADAAAHDAVNGVEICRRWVES